MEIRSLARQVTTYFVGRERGTTLVEMVVVVGLLGLAVGLVVTSVFQVLGIERTWRDEVVATRVLRHATSQFASDALNTQSIDLNDGQSAATVTLQWLEDDDLDRSTPAVLHTATYSQVGNRLIRDIDGSQVTVARNVTSLLFTRTGDVVTLDLSITAELGTTESVSLDTFMRFINI